MDKRSCLTNESLDDLLLLKTSGITLTGFFADPSIDLWWSDKTRRPSQKKRKKYKSQSYPDKSTSKEEDEASGESGDENMLEEWDELMCNDDSDSD